MKKIKIPYLNLLPILLIAFLLFKLVNSMKLSLDGIFGTLYQCVSYFVFGFVLAYLLNPALNFFEGLIRSKRDTEKMRACKRACIITFIYVLLLGSFSVFVVAVIPTIREAIQELMDNVPRYASYFRAWIDDISGTVHPYVSGNMDVWIEECFQFLYNWLQKLDLSSIGGAVSSGVSTVASVLVHLGFGLVISIYFLFSKEQLLLGLKKMVYALLSRERGDKLLEVGRKTHRIFVNFIVSKVLQSLIMFVLGLLVLVPIGVPFALLISLFIALTNMIPYFGPYIGAIPSVLLVLFYSPVMALWVLLYAVGVQILDNVIIGPKIMSDKVGISPLLVILGVTIGGALGGVLGMIIGVPVVAVVKFVFYDPYIEKKLNEKSISI